TKTQLARGRLNALAFFCRRPTRSTHNRKSRALLCCERMSLSALERHVSFFQGANWHTDFVTYSDFVTSLRELDVPWAKCHAIAFIVLASKGAQSFEDAPVDPPTWCCTRLFGPLVV